MMDMEKKALRAFEGLGEAVTLLAHLAQIHHPEPLEYDPIGTPLNPFENEVDPFADDANPITDYENAMHELKKLQKEHNELLSVIAPIGNLKEQDLVRLGAWLQCRMGDNSEWDKIVKHFGSPKSLEPIYQRLVEVVDRINEWYNGR